ncbi:MAG: winged helix-turn-helix domain-containing protein [Candidatus Diapherotrites archaeon]
MSDEKLARAIGARSRRNILKILCKRKQVSVHELADELDLSESLASRHLKMLYDLGLIDSEYSPPEKFYFLKIKELNQFFKAYDKVTEKI